MYYFLALDAFQALSHAERSPGAPTSAERIEFAGKARPAARSGVGTATIRVDGILTKRPSLLAMFFGGNTSYDSIGAALKSADADPSVSDIVLHIDSPGGEVDGLFSLLDVMGTITKPMSAKAENATSAAYAIACAAGKIQATNAGARFGSVGVVANIFVENDMVTVTSTQAPDKRPDVRTDAGRATVRKHLDDLHGLFAKAIARGRSTTVARVNADFGRGGVVLAHEAKQLGMIDDILIPARRLGAAAVKGVFDALIEGRRKGESSEEFVRRCYGESADATDIERSPAPDLVDQTAAAMGLVGDMPEATPARSIDLDDCPDLDLQDRVVVCMLRDENRHAEAEELIAKIRGGER